MERLDFDKTIQQIKELGTGAQTTFLYRLVKELGAGVTRTLVRYCFARLDSINKQLPDSHPYKRQHHDRKDKAHQQSGKQPV